MLILGRKKNQSIRIGDEIVVTILAVDGDRVKVGIDAPAHIRILRQELEVEPAKSASQNTAEDSK
ncbi:MAG: carbon storage regulator [Chloroflexi bacterium]|nr:MAG: carbon storage regulator [Chloroflexota bacterium]